LYGKKRYTENKRTTFDDSIKHHFNLKEKNITVVYQKLVLV